MNRATDFEIAYTDFLTLASENRKEAEDRLVMLLGDPELVQKRLEFLHVLQQGSEQSMQTGENYADELSALAPDGVLWALRDGRITLEKLDEMTRSRDALLGAHQAIVDGTLEPSFASEQVIPPVEVATPWLECIGVFGDSGDHPSAALVGSTSLEVFCPVDHASLKYGVMLIELSEPALQTKELRLETALPGRSSNGQMGVVASIQLSVEQVVQFKIKRLHPRLLYDPSFLERLADVQQARQLLSRRVMNDPATRAKLDAFIQVLETRNHV